MLHDTRTRRHSGDEHERQFLVGEDEDEDDGGADTHLGRPKSLEEDVQSFSSNASMDAFLMIPSRTGSSSSQALRVDAESGCVGERWWVVVTRGGVVLGVTCGKGERALKTDEKKKKK